MNVESIVNNFYEEGYVVVRQLIDASVCDAIKEECEKILFGNYSTNIIPDKVKWDPKDKDNTPRSICNGWKSSHYLTTFIRSNPINFLAMKLMNWNSLKLNQDSIIFLPPNAGGVTMHQDNSYQDWHSPGGVITAWIALSDCNKDCGGLEYIPKSHLWKISDRVDNFITAPNHKYDIYAKNAAKLQGNDFKIVKPIFKKGDVGFHHGLCWHGSANNINGNTRSAYALHFMNGISTFNECISPFFSRYKLHNSYTMDDAFFPKLI